MNRRTIGALLAWLAFLALALLGLHALGHGRPATPPSGDLSGWLESNGAATAAFALLRLVALALGWYLLLTTLAAAVLHLGRAEQAAGGVEAVTPRFVRRLVRGAVGVTIAAGAMTTGAAADDAPVTMRRLRGEPLVEMRRLEDQPPVTMRRLPDGEPTPAPAPAPAPHPATWTVEPGQSFWVVAQSVLTSAWHRVPADSQIAPFWRRLVEANRDRLADPRNADLLFPQQVLEIPTPPPAPEV